MLFSTCGRLGCAESQQGRPAVVVCQVGLNQIWVSYRSLEEDCRQRRYVSGLGTMRLQATGHLLILVTCACCTTWLGPTPRLLCAFTRAIAVA